MPRTYLLTEMYTTSRYAKAETRKLAREMARRDDQQYISRGKKSLWDIADLARRIGDEEVLVLRQERGKLASISRMKILNGGGFIWKGRFPV